jgi:signal transduction histidine kinase
MTELLRDMARRWWLLPVLFVVTAGSIAVNVREETDQPALAAAFAVCGAVVLFAVDRWLPAVAVSGALAGAYFAVGGANGPAFLIIVVAAFLAAIRNDVRRWLPHVVLSGVLVWAGLVVRGVREDDAVVGLYQSLWVGALVAAAAAIATTLRTRLDAQRDRARRAASEEQLRMAQDLHDGVGHGLAVIAMQAGVALHVLDKDPGAARAAMEAVRDTSREALEALRAELSHLSGEPAPRTPRRGIDDIGQLVARVRAAGLEVHVDQAVPGPLPADLGNTAYAVAQEALTNVLRHAAATRVALRIVQTPDTLEITVTDDGRGGEVHDEGMGLTGMRERVAALGGTLALGPLDTGGFEVRATLPVAPA